MIKIKSVCFLLLFVISSSLQAQLKRANKYYEHYQYNRAIGLYKKLLKRGEDTEVLEKISNSLRITRNYSEAEKYYSRLVTLPGINPVDYFFYGEVLKNNNKIDEAKVQYQRTLNAFPNDEGVVEAIKSCDNVKLWVKKTQRFEITPADALNTVHSEFSPVFFKNKLLFTSDRTQDLLDNNGDTRNKQPYLDVYSIEIVEKKDSVLQLSKSAELLGWPINTDFHDGPLCFDEKNSTMYITRVDNVFRKRDLSFVNRPQLYSAVLVGNKWESFKSFKYNNPSYSLAYPSISADGQWLYFASDMPGGKGGLDIYRCHKEEDGWGPPQNMGDEVNSKYDEAFPYIRKDGMLYFSSDRHSGFGGLDIYSATKVNDKYTEVTNLGAPLNSSTDDFGILYLDDFTRGYFSSDRASGKGADDIYTFKALNKFVEIEGKLLLSQNINDPLRNMKIKLMTEEGKLIETAVTEQNGHFKFAKLDPDIKYMVQIDESNPVLVNIEKVYMANNDNKIVRVIVINDKGGSFVFMRLPLDPNEMELAQEADNTTFAGNLFSGEDASQPLADTKINLLNDKGEVIATGTTNGRGAFVFSHLPADQTFLVQVDETDSKLTPNTKITITNKNGTEIQTTRTKDKGKFDFTFLASDKHSLEQMTVEDKDLRFDFKGKIANQNKVPLANSVVNIVNEKGEIVATTHTNAKGGFQFTNLPTDKSILFAIDENDIKMDDGLKYYLTDAKGNVIKEFGRNKNGKFDFTILPSDIKKLGELYVDDTKLSFSRPNSKAKPAELPTAFKYELKVNDTLSGIENLYYDFNEHLIMPQSIKTLFQISYILENNPNYNIVLRSFSDSRGTSEYNLKLSQLRAKSAKEFLIVEGIEAQRIFAKGYGESQLLNKCSEGVYCDDEEHAKNRRTEIRIYRKK